MISTLIHRLQLTLLALALPSLLGSGLSAQSGSFTNFGVSCRNDVALRATSTPRLGQPFQVIYVGPYDPNFVGPRDFSYQPYLLTGASNTSFGGATLPLLFPTAITGGLTTCSLLVSADIVTPLPVVPNVPPLHSLTLTIPGTPALLGASFFQQWLLVTTTFDMRTNQTTVSVASSHAGHGVIGI